MALFKSMAQMANMTGTMFPGTIVPIPLELPRLHSIILRLGVKDAQRAFLLIGL
jgi:hypothetical protein